MLLRFGHDCGLGFAAGDLTGRGPCRVEGSQLGEPDSGGSREQHDEKNDGRHDDGEFRRRRSRIAIPSSLPLTGASACHDGSASQTERRGDDPGDEFLDRFGFEDDDEQCGESARGQSGDRIFGCGRSGVGFPELFDLAVVLMAMLH